MLSARTTHLLKPFALALAVAALAAPTAQAKLTPAGKYGPLDPWAYKLIHKSAQSVPLTTEHSVGQNGTDQLNVAQSAPVISEHSVGQNSSAAAKYGPLDPGIAAAIRSHPGGQNGESRSAAMSVRFAAPNGFDWVDAGIGAIVAFGSMLFVLGLARLIPRRSHSRLAA
jgi:hypothetical protein